jgi:hypothetical protein
MSFSIGRALALSLALVSLVAGCLGPATTPPLDGAAPGTSPRLPTAIHDEPAIAVASYMARTLNAPVDPLLRGPCGELRCGDGHDIVEIRVAPHVTAASTDASWTLMPQAATARSSATSRASTCGPETNAASKERPSARARARSPSGSV